MRYTQDTDMHDSGGRLFNPPKRLTALQRPRGELHIQGPLKSFSRRGCIGKDHQLIYGILDFPDLTRSIRTFSEFVKITFAWVTTTTPTTILIN